MKLQIFKVELRSLIKNVIANKTVVAKTLV